MLQLSSLTKAFGVTIQSRVAIAIALVGVVCAGLQLGAQRPVLSDYLVGPQDALQITVFDEPDLSGIFTVDSDGTITFPLISRVSVDGLAVREIQNEITRQLGDGFLVNPQVSIEIAEYRSQNVYVLGEVANPGIYRLSGQLSLIEVLVVGRLALITLRDGDTVNVPNAPTFYVLGHVASPGSYVWTRGITVQQAIALAGGYTSRGSNRGIRITRTVDGERTEVSVREDDPVQPNDTISIRARRF